MNDRLSEPSPETELPADYKDRQSQRKPLNIPTRMSHRDRCDVEILLCDVSSSGFMAACAERVPIGSYVCLDLPGLGIVRARVRWQIGDRLGGQFLDPIRLSRCAWTGVTSPIANREEGAP